MVKMKAELVERWRADVSCATRVSARRMFARCSAVAEETPAAPASLFRWSKNGRSVVRDADRHATVVGESRQTFDAGEVET